jgi:hypothetical protein
MGDKIPRRKPKSAAGDCAGSVGSILRERSFVFTIDDWGGLYNTREPSYHETSGESLKAFSPRFALEKKSIRNKRKEVHAGFELRATVKF